MVDLARAVGEMPFFAVAELANEHPYRDSGDEYFFIDGIDHH
jgi:hypothetical protein